MNAVTVNRTIKQAQIEEGILNLLRKYRQRFPSSYEYQLVKSAGDSFYIYIECPLTMSIKTKTTIRLDTSNCKLDLLDTEFSTTDETVSPQSVTRSRQKHAIECERDRFYYEVGLALIKLLESFKEPS